MLNDDFYKPILLKSGVYKWKPLSVFSFRKLHRALIKFYDRDLQKTCCELAGVESVGDYISYGYCCVDEEFGLQFYILGAYNRNGTSNWWVSVPEGKEIVFSYNEAKNKLISLSDPCPVAVKQCISRCKHLMEQHEKNITIMLYSLDAFRNIEFPLDIQVRIHVKRGIRENVLFRPTEKVRFMNVLRGYLLEEPRFNTNLHRGDFLEMRLVCNEYRKVVAIMQDIPNLLADWIDLRDGDNAEEGPAGGIILESAIYKNVCGIILEKCTNYFAVTCVGIEPRQLIYSSEKKAYKLYHEVNAKMQAICAAYNPQCAEDMELFSEHIGDAVDEIAAEIAMGYFSSYK